MTPAFKASIKTAALGRCTMTLAVMVASTAALVIGSGCATRPVESKSILTSTKGSVVYGTFVPQGEAKLSPPQPLTSLYAVGDGVYAYTQDNTVYALSQGLDIRFIKKVVDITETLRPPVQLGEEVMFPSSSGIVVTTKSGAEIRTVVLPHPLSSDVHVDQRGLLLAGIASPTGGRVAVLDPTRTTRATNQETLIGAVRSAPVSMQGIVFAATEEGRVFAIGNENLAAWPLDGMSFDTGRAVEADLVVDDYALYVASTDMKLYALDLGTGKIKWRYPAQVPLRQKPLVTKERVYQVLPGKGLASINKLEGKLYREPLWIAEGVTKVLNADDKYVYAAQGTTRLVALGIEDGKVKFSASGKFDFVTAGNDAIFVGSEDGRIVKLKRGPYTGESAMAEPVMGSAANKKR